VFYFNLVSSLNRSITKTVDEVVLSEIPPDDKGTPANSKPGNEELTSPIPGDTASPTGVVNGAVMPKLSAATDPFFLDMDNTPSTSKPVHSGVESLRERYTE